MSIQRLWFPHTPDGTIDASDRARIGIGWGGVIISSGVATSRRRKYIISFFQKQIRKSQVNANIIISLPLLHIDGSQKAGLNLDTLSTSIIGPNGNLLSGYDEAIFTEPNSNGIYTCVFSSIATNKAFTLEDQDNPYILILDSNVTNIEPTSIEIWISSKYNWETSKETSIESIYNYLIDNSSLINKIIVQPIQGRFSI